MTDPILSIRNLTVEIPTRHGLFTPVRDVSYDIYPGEIRGVVGESGAGKSMTGNAVIGLLDDPARIASGEIWLKGRRIDHLSVQEQRAIRGREIGMIFQDPLASLDPRMTIAQIVAEPFFITGSDLSLISESSSTPSGRSTRAKDPSPSMYERSPFSVL